MIATNKRVLVTGATGFIGSHTVLELINKGYYVLAMGNANQNQTASELPTVLTRVLQLARKECRNFLSFCRCNLLDTESLENIFKLEKFDSVIHLASLKGVADSLASPLDFYLNNLKSTMNLLKMCRRYNVKEFVFASSATVYGSVDQTLPIKEYEQTGLRITNPYGRSKHMLEQLITDFCASRNDFYATILRLFDPAGAHPSGLLGEDTTLKSPKHLMPFIALVASEKQSHLNVFGNKFSTRDGTGVRDFIHIMDVVKAQVASLERMQNLRKINKAGRAEVFNIGSGKGSTVLEMVKAFEKASEKKISYKIMEPRPGDIASIVSDLTAAQKKLKWTPKLSVDDMCRDIWNWQINNLNGYD